MPFTVRDQNTGRLMFETSMRSGSFLAYVDIGGAGSPQDGSISNPLLAIGTPYAVAMSGGANFTRENVYPTFSFSGNTFSWHYPMASAAYDYQHPPCRVLLGVKPGAGPLPPFTGPRLCIRDPNTGIIQLFRGGLCFQLAGKGTAYTRTDYRVGNTSPSVILIPNNPTAGTRLIAVRSTGFPVAKWGSITINGQVYAIYSCGTAATGQPVDYWIFDIPENIPSGGHGLKLRDPNNGRMLYNSNYDALRIMDVPTVNASIDNPSTFQSYPSGRTYAVVQPMIAGYNSSTEALYRDGLLIIDDGNYDGSYHTWSRQNDGKLLGTWVDGATVRVDPVSFDDVIGQTPGYAPQPDPATVYWSNPMTNLIVVDVTGL